MLKKCIVIAGLLLLPVSAHSQIAWDTPLLVSPNEMPGWGLYLAEVAGGDLGVIGTYRSPAWGFGLRGGLAETNDDDIGVLFGVDVEGDIVRHNANFPLDVDWVFGGGIGTGDGARVSVPLGLVAGRELRAEGATLTPYVSPRVVFDLLFGRDTGLDEDDETDAELSFAVDLGLDLRFSNNFMIRFGGTFGDRDGVAIGVVF